MAQTTTQRDHGIHNGQAQRCELKELKLTNKPTEHPLQGFVITRCEMTWKIVTVRSVKQYLVEINEDGSESAEEVVQETMFSNEWDEMETEDVDASADIGNLKAHFNRDRILEL